jgi:hypothetical protein
LDNKIDILNEVEAAEVEDMAMRKKTSTIGRKAFERRVQISQVTPRKEGELEGKRLCKAYHSESDV